jgi:hypothetical protein
VMRRSTDQTTTTSRTAASSAISEFRGATADSSIDLQRVRLRLARLLRVGRPENSATRSALLRVDGRGEFAREFRFPDCPALPALTTHAVRKPLGRDAAKPLTALGHSKSNADLHASSSV